MSAERDDEETAGELSKLLPSTVENTSTKVSTVNEKADATTDARKKFFIVKLTESKTATGSSAIELDDLVLNKNLSDDEDDDDDDDIFLENEPLKDFNTNEQQFREIEGQDTITSLTNNVFKKQLEKMKLRSASLKSGQSSTSSADSEKPANLPKNQSAPSSSYETLKSLFVNQEPDRTAKGLPKNGRKHSTTSTRSVKSTSVTNVSPKRLVFRLPSKSGATTVNETGSVILDALRDVMVRQDNRNDATIDDAMLKQILDLFRAEQILMQRKQKDKTKRLCFFAEMLVIFMVLAMTILFARTVINQIEFILNLNATSSHHNNRPANFHQTDIYILNNDSMISFTNQP